MKLKLLLSVFFISVIAHSQCSITTTSNASSYACGVAPLNGCSIVYIGDGITPMVLNMDASLNLTCLGPIQFVVRNAAALDFSPGNNNLTLAAGSSLILQPGCNLISGSCNASERIFIGTDLIATCNGSGPGADYSFPQLLSNGGYNIVTASISPVSVCGSGTFSLTATPYPSTGATIKWYTVASGGSPIFTGNPFSTGTISSSTTYYVEAFYSSPGITTPRIGITATVNSLPSTPTFGTITQTTCVQSTGSVIINNLPPVGTWTLTRTGTSSATTTGTGTSTTVSGLAVGNYNFTVTNGICTSLTSATLTINPPIQSIWNGASWSNPPSSSNSLVFNGNFSSAADLNGCDCNVNSGNVVFNSGHTLNLLDKVNIAGGSLRFNDGASLLQQNTVMNSGSMFYNRNTSPVLFFDYTFWSAPTQGTQTLGSFSPGTNTNRFFTYHNNWANANPSTDVFQSGVGYAIMVPAATSLIIPSIISYQFFGTPNNGDYNIPVTLVPPISNRLIGNPYPSAIDANAFINANINVTGSINQTISGTLYFWTHNHRMINGNFNSSDYATYNLSGGTAVATGSGNTNTPNQFISAGQGFFIATVANGNVSFRNNMRLSANNTNFYKSNIGADGYKKNRIWLNLKNETLFSQLLFGYIKGASKNYDNGFDGADLKNSDFSFYTLLNKEPYKIQAYEELFDENDQISLGYRTKFEGELEISIDKTDGIFKKGQSIFLFDKEEKTIVDLKESNYTFKTTPGTFDNRFILLFKKTDLTDESLKHKIQFYKTNTDIIIKSDSSMEEILVYDLSGNLIYNQDKINNSNTTVNINLIHSKSIYILKILFKNGDTVIKKYIY